MLDKAFEFAGQALNSKISKKTIQIVKHSRSTFLYIQNLETVIEHHGSNKQVCLM